MPQTDRIATIILNYNSCADSRKCIGYLKQQKGVELEIVVVDNCSREDDRLAVEQLCKEQNCTFTANNKNKGYNAGNNIGLRYAAEKGYEFAMIANPDMEFPQTDYLATLLAKMQEDKDIVVCGSDIIGADGIHQSPMGKEGNWRGSFAWIKEIFGKKKKKATRESVLELLAVETLEIEIGYRFVSLLDVEKGGDLLDRVVMIRRQLAMELGMIVPVIRLRDNIQLSPYEYCIKVKGVEVSRKDGKAYQASNIKIAEGFKN